MPRHDAAVASLPDLPAQGPLRLLAIAGSAALLALVAAVALSWRTRREAAWAAGALLAAALTFAVGRHLSPLLHLAGSLLTLGLAVRNAVALRGPSRVLSAVAAAAWLVALFAARRLFH